MSVIMDSEPAVKMQLDTIEILPKRKHSATLIFLHSFGDSAVTIMNWNHFILGRDLHIYDHVKIIFPTAPKQMCTSINRILPAWYDFNRYKPNMNMPENKPSYALSDELIGDLISRELVSGIPLNRIIVGGFSQGGSYALHIGYRTHLQIAGVFVMAPTINYDSMVYDNLIDREPSLNVGLPRLLCFHGSDDDLLPIDWGVYVFRELTRLGAQGEFHTMPNVKHEVRMWQLLRVESWARELLPPLSDDLIHKL